ncbi:MAG: hydrolase [Candidatus Saccharibacteria bacterium]|nr:hydrolase [Candidatus Saccharibacteria bacterium]
MRRLEISLGLIQKDETYLMQRRENSPTIGAAGLIGAFGGKIEPGEEPHEAASRELGEETSLTPQPDDFEFIGTVNVFSDYELDEVEIAASVFRLILEKDTTLVAREGEVVTMTKEDALRDKHLLTPATRAVFEELM